ncbi:putative mitochondrial pyruvate carrier 2 [Paramyrothecium foliicola]|nr:putative mitochondrial pyruvate carrier 2 [Paramyrothecium foliicola]
MAPSNTFFRTAAQPLFRQGVYGAQARQAFRSPRFAQQARRWQSTASETQQSWFKKAWESEVGVRTVHFWAPVMKLADQIRPDCEQWALVLAGIADFARPAEKLSLTQNAALTATGTIWTRWCFVIRPKNYLLAAVNFFLAIVGVVQCSRILSYEASKKDSVAEVVQDVKDDVKEQVEQVKQVKA